MNPGKKTCTAVLFMGILLATPQVQAQKNSPGIADREMQRRSLAVNLAHAINAAEAHYKKDHGAYATWDTLLSNGDFTDTGTKWAPETYPTVAHATYNRGPEIVPGWKLRLILSKDGETYSLMLEDVTDLKCGYAAVSDERGQIRLAKSVDCQM